MSDVIIKKPSGEFFPHKGDRRSEKHWNDPGNRLNRRRFRVDPLKDGYDSGEDPTREDGPAPKKPEIPI
jgi:hypothetical protein